MKRILIILVVVVVASVAVTLWIKPWVDKKVSYHSDLYLPEVAATSMPEKEELAYRWLHKRDTVDLHDRLDELKSLDLVAADMVVHIERRASEGFYIEYLALATDGKVYHAEVGDVWSVPYKVVSVSLVPTDEQLKLVVRRDFFLVGFYYVLATLFPSVMAFVVTEPRGQ